MVFCVCCHIFVITELSMSNLQTEGNSTFWSIHGRVLLQLAHQLETKNDICPNGVALLAGGTMVAYCTSIDFDTE